MEASGVCAAHNLTFKFVCPCSPHTPRCIRCLEDGHDHGDEEPFELAEQAKRIRKQWVNTNKSIASVQRELRQFSDANTSGSKASRETLLESACDDVNRRVDSLRHKLEIFRNKTIEKLREVYNEHDEATRQCNTSLKNSAKMTEELLTSSRAAFEVQNDVVQLTTFGDVERSWLEWKDDEATRSKCCSEAALSLAKLEQQLSSATNSVMLPVQVSMDSLDYPLVCQDVSDEVLLSWYENSKPSFGARRTEFQQRLEICQKMGNNPMAAALFAIVTKPHPDPSNPRGMFGLVLPWLQSQAASRRAAACFAMGEAYLLGARDVTSALIHYRIAAELDCSSAQNTLGCLHGYARNEVVERNDSEAARYYRLAAERGHAGAQCTLAECYRNGTGVKVDEGEAMKYLRLAAEQKYAEAFRLLGTYIAAGFGRKASPDEALRCFREAVNMGSAEAHLNMGQCYADGAGVEKDFVEAAKHYRKGAEQGVAEAQYRLGKCYMEGTGVKKDMESAARFLRSAADGGCFKAEIYLANFNCYGIGDI